MNGYLSRNRIPFVEEKNFDFPLSSVSTTPLLVEKERKYQMKEARMVGTLWMSGDEGRQAKRRASEKITVRIG